MRILVVAALHHPEAPPLFPPGSAQHFQEKALRKSGHTLDVFYGNLPMFDGSPHIQRHRQGLMPRKIV